MSNTKSNQTTEILNLAKASLDKLKEISVNKYFNLEDLNLEKLGALKKNLFNLSGLEKINLKDLNDNDRKKINEILNDLKEYTFGIVKENNIFYRDDGSGIYEEENNFETVKLNTSFRDDGNGINEIDNLKKIQGNIDGLIKDINKQTSESIERISKKTQAIHKALDTYCEKRVTYAKELDKYSKDPRNKGQSANLNLQNVNLEVDPKKEKTTDAVAPGKN